MFPEQLKKILNLIKKTGDRVIIFDSQSPENSYVVMGLDNYINLADGKQLVQSSVIEEKANIQELPLIPVAPLEEKENLTEEDLTDKINREISMWKNRDDMSYSTEDSRAPKAWQIPSQVKNKAQEVE